MTPRTIEPPPESLAAEAYLPRRIDPLGEKLDALYRLALATGLANPGGSVEKSVSLFTRVLVSRMLPGRDELASAVLRRGVLYGQAVGRIYGPRRCPACRSAEYNLIAAGLGKRYARLVCWRCKRHLRWLPSPGEIGGAA